MNSISRHLQTQFSLFACYDSGPDSLRAGKRCQVPILPRNSSVSASRFAMSLNPVSSAQSRRHGSIKCKSGDFSESPELEPGRESPSESMQPSVPGEQFYIIKILKESNSFLPHAVIASTLLALVYPPSFTWFTNRYYAPALGFLMFAVGVNSSERDFLEAFKRPAAISAGYIGQFIVKPLLGAGVMLTSCVSGAQLSNYATFLTDPSMAPLSIVMTSLSTATAVFVTPLLSLLLIGKRLPVDVKGMVSSILQIVVAPITAGLLLNRFFPWICNAIRPLLPPLSVFVTALCVGAPLAINVDSIMSSFGLTILLIITAFHLSAFIIGYFLPGFIFQKAPDVKALQRTLSFETGMQSSLLALALANRFFQDPLVAVPPAISVSQHVNCQRKFLFILFDKLMSLIS
ncbi:probable sodium/metabolite cotransporter BASS6, chloroplastic isoform X3 [Rhodamnia argentea]|uniref:Probable sodium/metabolite cotransporter BASS6, chloroplastic isoform X3 n=1 Tax=Rhodamnia argentea TaxID=178133 RepID=A0ABM3H6A0_9MYRT|nr:probable sodium/metabolite cotransporter BASS6, chloroplastic isoform X3 [Rhodamnia argentea]